MSWAIQVDFAYVGGEAEEGGTERWRGTETWPDGGGGGCRESRIAGSSRSWKRLFSPGHSGEADRCHLDFSPVRPILDF